MTQPVYAAPPRQKNNAGCILGIVVTLFVLIVMGVAAFLLPPFSLYDRLTGEPFAAMTREGDTLMSEDGRLQLRLLTDSDDFGVQLDTVTPDTALIPPMLALQSDVYGLRIQGMAAGLQLALALPTSNLNPDVLDVYGWYENPATARNEWRFIPAQIQNGKFEALVTEIPTQIAIFQAAPVAPEVLVSYPINRALTADVASATTIVAPGGLQPTMSGKITGSLAPGFDLNADYAVMPVLRNYADVALPDTETISMILNDATLREQHTREVASMVTAGGFSGILIDYRGIDVADRDAYSAFITGLSDSLSRTGRDLIVRVPAADNEQGVWQTGAYDWQALGAAADYLQIDLPLNPLWYLPGEREPVEAMLRYALREVSRYKILTGLSAQSIEEADGIFIRTGYDAGLSGMGSVRYEAAAESDTGSVEPGTEIRAELDGLAVLDGVDTRINAPYLDYLDADGVAMSRVWLTTGDALRYRMDKTLSFAMGGVAFDDLMRADVAGDLFESIGLFKQQIPASPAATSLALRWQIQGSGGDIIGEEITGLNDTLVVTLNAPDGNYAINAVVEGAGRSENLASALNGVQVAQFRPTATPTPLPTSTPTPVPTVTPTPVPIIPTAAPAEQPDTNTGTAGSSNAPSAPANP
ncbi:MAG: hypothetical protein ACPG7F_14830, partial [Aggregatilineales bacterium]